MGTSSLLLRKIQCKERGLVVLLQVTEELWALMELHKHNNNSSKPGELMLLSHSSNMLVVTATAKLTPATTTEHHKPDMELLRPQLQEVLLLRHLQLLQLLQPRGMV